MAIRICAWGGRYGNLEITRLCCMYGACSSSVEECSLLWLRFLCFLRFLRCEGSICRPYYQDRHLHRMMKMLIVALIWSPGLLFQCDIGTALKEGFAERTGHFKEAAGAVRGTHGASFICGPLGPPKSARSTKGEGALEVVSGPEEVRLLSHQSTGHVRCLLLVRVCVLHHPVLADETLSTHITRERFFAGVQAHVSPQVCLVVELLRADLTLVRLVPWMLRHVLLKQRFG